MIDFIKARLYKMLGLKRYLRLLQTIFLTGYKTGLLRADEKYKWHYFVKKLVTASDTVIDIGANLGYFSYVFSSIIKEEGNLFSVEPVEPYRRLLEKLLPKRSNIKVLPFALGNENKAAVKIGMPPMLRHLQYLRHGTVTILKDENVEVTDKVFECDVRKASEVFTDLKKIDYIKCDIEGYETVVFPELRSLLLQHQPLVQLETWGEQLPVMLAFFKEIGFTAYNLEKNKLRDCTSLSLEQIASSDILFVPSQRMEKIKDFL